MTSSAPTPPFHYASLNELRDRLGNTLVEDGRLKPEELKILLQRSEWRKQSLESLLVTEKYLSEEQLVQTFASITGLPVLKNTETLVDNEAVSSVPPGAALRYRIMPLQRENSCLILASDHPRDPDEIAELMVILGYSLQWKLCTAREITGLIKHFYGVGLAPFLQLRESETRTHQAGRRNETGTGIPDFIDALIREAIQSNASDIHIEPQEDTVVVRYRIDGVLHNVPLPEGVNAYQKAIISSIKVMANLDIADRRMPQDGRIEKKLDEESFDIRISVLPTRMGETVELRLLNREDTFLGIDELGLASWQRKKIQRLIQLPHGLLLFTGPTGSGKTTSQYAVLAEANDSKRKIITIEDPVEYQVKGITQLQTHAEIGFTFAHGLRSVLRHDPDIILVGEIRDDETARIAVGAALTGHLVLSTLHTNDSAGSAPRLIDMGIEPYLVASSLQGIISQRLVRSICPHCKQQKTLEDDFLEEVQSLFPESTPPYTTRAGCGCPYCRFTGYQNRRALFELMEITDPLRSLIAERSSSPVLMQQAIKQGMTPLRQAGWELVLNGHTTLEELLRITGGG
ncbi:MAG: ATPase, T2SS/T4P/T4SS family [Kiritimatiellia bacterium]